MEIMPDQNAQNQLPPNADAQRAKQYVEQIIPLINSDQLMVKHINLSEFDPTHIQDHYQIDIENFGIEISHTKKPDTGQDIYVMIFNQLNQTPEKTLLAFAYIEKEQFMSIKTAADNQDKRQKDKIEAARFSK